jgi:cobaltochelatase CobN
MHLLRTTPGGFVDDSQGVVRIDQTPANIVILSSADTTLSLLAAAYARINSSITPSDIAPTAPTDSTASISNPSLTSASMGLAPVPAPLPSLRLANLAFLRQPASIDFYEDDVLQHAQVVIVDHLGGESYWPYGIERVIATAERLGQHLIMFSGDLQEDPALIAKSTVEPELCRTLWQYLREGGPRNAESFLHHIMHYAFAWGEAPRPPAPFPAVSIYHPDHDFASAENWAPQWQTNPPNAPVVAILFYKAHLQAGNTAVFDAIAQALIQEGLNPLPIAVTSLKDPLSIGAVRLLCERHAVALVLNTTAFAATSIDNEAALQRDPLAHSNDDALHTGNEPIAGDAPILQLILSSANREDWLRDDQGLRARDVAMHVALPEVDGRIITRAVSFKGLAYHCALTQVDVVHYQADHERIAYVAELSRRWCSLRTGSNNNKRIALIMANYPQGEGRIGNGVGLDTPESVVNILTQLIELDYSLSNCPVDGEMLMQQLTAGVTNDPRTRAARPAFQSLSMANYRAYFVSLPETLQHAVLMRWGPPQIDPTVRQDRFMIAGMDLGGVFVGIQPSRTHEHGDYASYHDADIVPPHAYLAFYWWLREYFNVDAVVHVGKHGNLEWLPGKSVALSAQCWPDLILGPMPHLYPFIVNDPGEGSQAKRRTQAVIIDHLMPPLTRAETYGPLQDLERQVDEYYEALMVDPRRSALLRRTILATIVEHHLHEELGMPAPSDPDAEDALLTRADAYLCELKEAQIRDGLHTFGISPTGQQRRDTLLALSRYPVGDGKDQRAGLIAALAADLDLGDDFDPLSTDAALPWNGPRPAALQHCSTAPWRHHGDTRERLELLAQALLDATLLPPPSAASIHVAVSRRLYGLPRHRQPHEPIDNPQAVTADAELNHVISGTLSAEMSVRRLSALSSTLSSAVSSLMSPPLPRTEQVLKRITTMIAPRLDACGPQEIYQLCRGLAGRFVPPGPSGAPSRGRPDVLPTGRNFYSVDTRSIPTQSAWALGLKSANQLVERHLQDHGDFPRAVGLSVWGTATMRTGGDDIAQAFALMGVRPRWAAGSHRVSDFEILPVTIFDRPRIDVTLRVSGFFRDAFANVMHLFDAAVQAVAELDEPADVNPIRARILAETDRGVAAGLDADTARERAGWRVFGSRPGSYGAGLDSALNGGDWQDDADLADAYRQWGGFAYSRTRAGTAAEQTFGERLATIDAVVQNQDNREHDILDSNDYHQFQGGMTAAVRHLSGTQPAIYLADHSQVEHPRVRTLTEEIARVIRSRVVNPKWIDGIKRHGYKGAAELADTVDCLFGYDATARVVADHQYALVADAYVNDPDTRAFIERHNPHALHGICERLLEAMQRGLWQSPGTYQQQIEGHLLSVEHLLEGRS